jgi:hypothetical protein
MPDEIKTPPNPAENNKNVADKLLQQGEVSPHANDLDVRHSQDALDELAAAKTKENEDKPVIEAEPETPPADDEATKKAAAEKAAADEKAAAEKKASDEASLKKHEDIFKDTPSLPANASPKSSEAFTAVKLKAAQEISAREQELEKVRKENEDLKTKVGSVRQLTPELETELKELRDFRNRLDVEADPKFKEFQKTVASSQEFIYAQLRKSPVVDDKVIDEIKKYGGPEMVDLSKLFEKIKDPTLQRLVESKVADIEQAKWNREEAMKSAKANIGQYVSEREKNYEKAATAHRDATKVEFDELLKIEGLAWMKPQPIDPKADETTRKNIEGFNAFVTDVKSQLEEAAKDDSPKMRAVMLASVGNLLYLQKIHEATKSALATADADHKKVVESKDKEIGELKATIDKFKNASGSRLRESSAPTGGGKIPDKSNLNLDVRPADALEAIAKQVVEERAARGK